jgi:flagellar operon protein
MRSVQEHTNSELSFSWHARQRLEQRQLNISEKELERLDKAVLALNRKGGKLALVLLDQLAMLVSISNRRVITIAAREQLEQSVFTNIDSAAVA